jgi:probable HAF family extracellular repeat protein
MKRNYCRVIFLLLITIILCAFSSLPVFAQMYILTDLGSPIGGNMCRADDVNNTGQVVGWTTNAAGECFPFVWTKEDGYFIIGPLPVTHTYTPGPMSINNIEQVVGTAHFYSQAPPHAFLWTEENGINDLGAPTGPYYQSTSRAYDINDFGQVVGESDQTFGHRPLFWNSTGELSEIETLGFAGGARAINNLGYIVGWSAPQSGPPYATLWTDAGEVLDLGVGSYSEAFGINNLGDVVGYYNALPSDPHAFLLKVSGMNDLGTLGERRWSEAYDINDFGQIVGSSWTLVLEIDEEGQSWTDGDYHAFLWDEENGMQDLNDLIPSSSGLLLTHATAINNVGQIVGWAQMDLNGDGIFDEVHGFLLTPIASQWAKTYGGADEDYAFSIQQTSDSSYIVAGGTFSFGVNAWILKLGTEGNVLWQKTYGGSDEDYASSIQQTPDGGYIVAGTTYSSDSYGDAWVFKLDSSGNIEWEKIYGISHREELGQFILQTPEGGFFVTGNIYTSSMGTADNYTWVLKLDSGGNIQWQKAYGSGSRSNWTNSIQHTSDGGYILAGNIGAFSGSGTSDSWVLKLDSGGNVQWQKAYGDSNNDERAYSIRQTSDLGYIVAGEIYSPSPSHNAWLFKLDSAGAIQWQKIYDIGSWESLRSIQETPEGGYIATGSSGGSSGRFLKLDSYGNVQVERTYSEIQDPNSLQQTSDGGYIMAGFARSYGGAGGAEALVLKLDSSGNIPGCQIIGTSNATVIDTNIDVTTPSVEETITNATAQTNTATVTDTNATVTEVCYNGPPSIGYSPTSFSFSATQGGSNPPNKSLSIWNAGGDTLTWSVSNNATSWLSLNPTSGTDSGTVTVSVNIAGLTTGTYDATITITATGATNSPVVIPVTLMINETEQNPVIDRIMGVKEPGVIVRIIGQNFGDSQGDSIVHIGPKNFNSSSSRIKLWSDSKIKIKLPNYQCRWFKGQNYRYLKVWVTVDSVDTNKKRIKVLKPDTCP